MHPTSLLKAEIKKEIRAVFSDFDDTLTEHSLLSSATLNAIERLHTKGYLINIVSGRPAGWGDCLMRILPIDALVFENGAGVMVREGKKIQTIRLAKDANITNERDLLQGLYDKLKVEIPDLKLATDQPYRLYDFAIDFCEEPPTLTKQEIVKALDFLNTTSGITAKLSSIHINYWAGTHTKITACEYLLKKQILNKSQVLYCGDSPNDEPLFEHFPHSVGVANIKQFWNQLKFRPAYITTNEGGLGFQEIAAELLS